MNQSSSINQSSGKKLITRSVTNTNQLTTQNSSRDKLPPYNSQVTSSVTNINQINSQNTSRDKLPPYNNQVTSSVNTSQQQSRQISFTTKQQKPNIQSKKTKTQNKSRNSSQQQQLKDKKMFYSELQIQTNDMDVPLVKILKVNQQLLKKFIQHSSSLENLIVMGRIRSISLGFRAMASHLIRSERYNLKVTKLIQTIRKLLKRRQEIGMSKLFATKNKFLIKQKGLIVLNRLFNSKLQSFQRSFFKNASQKKLISMVMNKVDQDEMVKMKMHLQIFRQITFSKEFILKCRGLMKYNPNNKGMFDKQLLKANFQQSLKLQLQRYEKIRQNVDNRNPNIQTDNKQDKKVVKRKPTNSFNNQSQYYENQVVLMAIKSFNLSLIDTREFYEQKISQLNDHISQLQTEQRYIQLQQLLNTSQSSSKAYESAINQLYSKSDEQIRKIITQFPLSKDEQVSKKKLLPVINTQRTKYQKLYQKHQKLYTSSQKPLDEYLMKFYKSRYFTLDYCHQLLNTQQNNQYHIYKQVYQFISGNLDSLVDCYLNQNKLKQLIDKVKKSTIKHQYDIMQQSSLIVVSLSECFLAIHQNYQAQKQKYQNTITKKQDQLKATISRQNQSSKKSLEKERTNSNNRQEETQKIQRKTSQTNNNSLIVSKNQSSRKQLLKSDTKVVIKEQQTTQKPIPTLVANQSQLTGYNVVIDIIRASIIEYLKSNNKNYQNGNKLLIDNPFVKKSLLPESKGRTKLQQNIQINSFVQQLNSQIQLLIKNLNESLISVNQSQLQLTQITQMISLFYELILSSTNNNNKQHSSSSQSTTNTNKFPQLNKKWTQLCRSKTHSQHKLHLINTFNSILMIHKQLGTKQSKPQQNFSEQLKKILKQKLQFQKLYNQTDKKLLIKLQEYNIIEKQNKEYVKKYTQSEKELNKLKRQQKNYEQNLQQQQQTITRLKEQLNVYLTNAKNQANQNNKLNREINKMKSQLNMLNQQMQRLKNKQTDRLKLTQQKGNNVNINTKNTYTFNEYTFMQSNYKLKLTQLQQSATEVQNHNYELNQTIIQLKTKLKDLQRTYEQTKFQVQRVNQQLERNKITLKQFTELENAYLAQIDKLQSERDQLLRILNQLRLKEQIQKKDKTLIDKTEYNRLKQLQFVNDNLQSTVQTFQKQITKLNRQIKNYKEQLLVKNTKITELEKQIQQMINKYTHEHQKQTTKLKHSYLQQISNLQHTIQTQESSHQSIIKQLHTKYEQFTNTINKKQSENIKNNTTSNTHTHSIINKHTHQLAVLQYDPQKQIKSLRQFIQTLQKQNQKLNTKYNTLKKQLYSDQTSTQFSHKSNKSHTHKELHSKQFYQSIVHDLKMQNDRLYGELLKVKSSSTSASSLQIVNSSQVVEESANQFWVMQIKRKQQHIAQLQLSVNQLNNKLQETKHHHQHIRSQFMNQNTLNKTKITQRIHELQLQLTKRTTHYNNTQQQLKQQLHSLSTKLSQTQRQCLHYKSQINQLKQSEQEQSLRINLNYSQLLLSTKQVKELFTSFIQATNAILYKLDRTSEIYLNFQTNFNHRRSSLLNNNTNQNNNTQDPNPYHQHNVQSLEQIIKLEQQQQARKAEQSIISLVEQFKTVIQNNHQTLKSIYQNLVCHPYTKTALELHYLKELTFTIISKFHTIPQLRMNSSAQLSPQPLSYTYQLARQQLAVQIDKIFSNTQESMKPIEEVFVQVEQLMVSKIQSSLDGYKKELHLKAVELDYIRQKLNLVVDDNLIDEQLVRNKIPYAGNSYQSSYQQQQSYSYNHNRNIPTMNPLNLSTQKVFHHNQYIVNHNYQYQIENSLKDSIRQQELKLQPFQGTQQPRRPFSGNWISKTSSNYEYRPLTSLIDKYDLMQEKLTQGHKQAMYRSYVNPFQNKHNPDQQYASGRFS